MYLSHIILLHFTPQYRHTLITQDNVGGVERGNTPRHIPLNPKLLDDNIHLGCWQKWWFLGRPQT